MTVYVDGSVVLRRVLNQPGHLEPWGQWEVAVCSELTRAECRRTLDRMRLQGKLVGTELAEMATLLRLVLEPLQEVRLLPAILNRAGSDFPAPLGTLDAIHLATALFWIEQSGEPLTFLTHDRQLALAARACGLNVLPPVP